MTSRRDFFRNISGLLGLSVFLSVPIAIAKRMALSLDKVPQLKKVGGSVVVAVKGTKVLFIRDGENSVRALSPICTHEKCTVAYSARQKKIVCSCHNSSFDLRGTPLGGPASRPLKAYAARFDGSRIIIDLK